MKMASPVEIHMGRKTDTFAQEMLKGKALSPKTLRAEPSEVSLGGPPPLTPTADKAGACCLDVRRHQRSWNRGAR